MEVQYPPTPPARPSGTHYEVRNNSHAPRREPLEGQDVIFRRARGRGGREEENHEPPPKFDLHDIRRTGKKFLEIIPCLLMISKRVNFRNLGTMKKMKRIGVRFHKEAFLQEEEHPSKMVLDE